jgi:metallopeptidase MepB
MSPARTPPQAPPNFGETPETLLQTAAHIQANYRDGLRELRRNIEPCCATFENLIQPLAALQNDYSWHFLQFYQCIPPNKELQEAATQASDLRCIMTDEIPDFSEHFKIINSKVEDLDVESQRLLHKILTDFAARPESDRVEEIDSLLGEIEGKIESKLVNDGSGLWLRETQLEGVPRDVIDGLKKGDRKYFVEYDSPACRKIQQWAVSPKVRRTIYIMSQRRVSKRHYYALLVNQFFPS